MTLASLLSRAGPPPLPPPSFLDDAEFRTAVWPDSATQPPRTEAESRARLERTIVESIEIIQQGHGTWPAESGAPPTTADSEAVAPRPPATNDGRPGASGGSRSNAPPSDDSKEEPSEPRQ
jgi:hypothetical protein